MERQVQEQADKGALLHTSTPASALDRDAVSSRLRRIPCEVYSRIVGYLRPVRNWHRGKQQEFVERRMFRPPE